MPILLTFYAFAVGAIIGSFLNVVIHRYPREESVVFPPSHCPSCNARIQWFDNVPVLSWIFLLGRCRNCRAPISLRYPLIEAANALFYTAIFLRAGFSVTSILIAALTSMTIALIYIDLEIQILPDVIDIPGIVIGLALAWFGAQVPGLHTATSIEDALIGAAAGAGVLLFIAVAYRLLRKIEGMGLGDVKMLAMIGSVTGWRALLPVLLIASISGAAVGMVMVLRGAKEGMRAALPFGVFLGLAFLIVLFFGDELALLVPAAGM